MSCLLQKKPHFLRHWELSLLKTSSPAWHVPPRGVPSTYKTLLRRSSISLHHLPVLHSPKIAFTHYYGFCLLFLLQNCQKSWKDESMLEPEHHSRPVHVCRSQTSMILLYGVPLREGNYYKCALDLRRLYVLHFSSLFA